MGETKELTGRAKLPKRGSGARGRERVADGRGQNVSEACGARSWAAWAGERGGESEGARGLVGPDSDQPRRGEFLFFFSFSNSSLFLFLFLFLLFLFPLNQKFSKWS
jgi:hypothetical protein